MAIYFNAYYNEDGSVFIESNGKSYADVVEEAGDYNNLHYAFTLEVDLKGETRRLDLSSEIADYVSSGLDYERLTGHEMGVCLGRV